MPYYSGKDYPEVRSLTVFGIVFMAGLIGLVIFGAFVPSAKSSFHVASMVIYSIAAISGLVCGLICAGRDRSPSSWFSKVFRFFLLPFIVFAIFGISIYFRD